MPSAFVTGSNGFVGFNLVERLRAEGWQVTASYRSNYRLAELDALGVRLRRADVRDPEALLAALPEQVDVVFHVAATVSFWKRRNHEQTLDNHCGTQNVVRAALERRARRLVHTSSVAAFGPENGDVLTEHSRSKAANHWVNYYRTKWLAELEVRRGIEQGLSAVILNPGNILGAGDSRNWGSAFLQAKAGKLPGIPAGSAPFCHVSDVVEAHLRAAHSGRPGTNYLLSGVQAPYREVFELVYERLGLALPRMIPAWLLKGYARCVEIGTRLRSDAPSLTPELAFALSTSFSADSELARRELGFSSRSLVCMVDDSYQWLKNSGLV